MFESKIRDFFQGIPYGDVGRHFVAPTNTWKVDTQRTNLNYFPKAGVGSKRRKHNPSQPQFFQTKFLFLFSVQMYKKIFT